MKKSSLMLSSLALLAVAAVPAMAGQITYTESATATGSLGTQNFRDALLTLTLVGDTSNVTGGAGFFSNTVGTFTVSIAGVGTATFTDAMEVFDNQGQIAAGFGDNSLGGSVLDTFDAVFGGYDLTTAIGPITNSPFIRPDLSFGTDAGLLVISASGDSTFTASTGTPEPGTFLLLGLGITSLGMVKMRRAAK
jgi:PEP-CTERM motif